MSFLSDVGNVLSGKTYKENVLVSNNLADFLSRLSGLADSKYFLKKWVESSLVFNKLVLDYFLFDYHDRTNTFNTNLDKLTSEGSVELTKLLVGHCWTAFKHNRSNLSALKSYGLDKKTFENDLFEFFSYERDDKDDFRLLDQLYGKEGEELVVYGRYLYQKMFKKGYGMPNMLYGPTAILMTINIKRYYVDGFMKCLRERLASI